ncbi:MAG: flagellar basal body rod modification protein [Rhizobiales bacterium 32-66-8]|nr:MAG: flagellar basal body rod modification protein [Rhizobiales bacterium 32-66-8]
MTEISSLSGATATATKTAAATAKEAATVDYNAFLQLLVAQLQNQDPTEPMDSTAYMSQLASFSQVEQSVASNAKLESLLTASALQTAGAAVGRTVTSADGSISGTVVSVQITDTAPVATLANGSKLALGTGVVMR